MNKKTLSFWPRSLMTGILLAMSMIASAGINLRTSAGTKLSEVISAIKSQSDYEFFYDDAMASHKVKAFSFKDADLKVVLDKILAGTGICYSIKDKIIYLKQNTQPRIEDSSNSPEKRTITGQLLDENGEPLIGANVVVKGQNTGVITDIDGNYSIEVSGENPELCFSYIGYKPQTVKVGDKTPLVISLIPDTNILNEVVVTALGIKRDKKMLGYAVQDVKGDALNTTGDPSVVGALDGKVAGLQMNTASTGLGGSTKITIRGNSSLTDNNQPLWIVDGVPFTDNNSSDASAYGGYDRGGTSFDLNPEDIESISVLKGPNAAALYGSRAGNGVILVTTKRGSSKAGFGVNYSGSFTWSQAAGSIKMQKIYGQGSNGIIHYETDSEGNPQKINDTGAFGPKFDGSLKPNYLGEMIPYVYDGDKLKDYFRTGFSQFHTVALSNMTDKSNYRLSVGFNDNSGLFDGEKLEKFNIDFSAGATLNKWLKSEGKVSVSNTKAENRPYTGLLGEVGQLLMIPGNVRLSDLKDYSNEVRPHVNWYGPDMTYSNPYFVRHRLQNSDERWRAFGFYGLTITFNDWMHFQAKYAFDYYRTRIEETDLGLAINAISNGTTTWQEHMIDDSMNRSEINHFEQNISATFIGDKSINDNWRIGFTAGGNIMYQKYELFGASVQNMLSKDIWIFNTGNKLTSATNDGHNRAMYSVFASAQMAFKEFLSLDLTARNDWSSTLPSKHNSFFYPSVNLGFVISDFARSVGSGLPAWITFAKVRLSAAQVGKDPDPYNLYNVRMFEYQMGNRKPIPNTIKMNSDLKPEIKTSYEVGLDMKFFGNRLGFDFTYYNSNTKNQAMLVDASAPWTQQWVNAGRITNKGVELMVYGTLAQTKDLTFNLSVNFAHNKSIVDELADGVNRIYFNGDPNMPVKVGAVSGGKLGDIYANNLMKRDANGNIIIGANGLPMTETGNGNLEQYLLDHPIGNIQPDLLMSVTPSFRWKNLTFSGMLDMKFGGDIVSVSEGMATKIGTSERTAYRGEFKEINGVSDYYMVVPGVKGDGSINDIPVSAQRYYSTIGLYKSESGYAEEFVHDASYIKLKELSVGYNFPKKWLSKTPLTNLRASFVARNLCYLMKHCPGNPEGGYDTSMFSQALDFLAVPYTRTYGFSVNVEF
ncbi:SusC/RagA family TonB-linked outer membrane protein [Prevotella sp. P4-51]|uniref:SusC/RagA family TonB-linked outer membrane protein n=1 Tax=Prevotella sp. P4-51 TaxID=2024228 RepID=UPI000B963968|nr:SusC/RagA family TonB-linked outer membrane protein [Prevotella sp. P4-51]OYP71007.1 SusC/RagA family TonB-linked outer membrane protein [Prevotella sp. P4-51]